MRNDRGWSSTRAGYNVLQVAARVRLTLRRAGPHMLFLAGGVLIGAIALGMARLADAAQGLFLAVLSVYPYAALIISPCGFALGALLTRRVFPNSQGSGIPQVIAALEIANPAVRAPLVSLRVGIGKIVVMTLGFLCGGSIGREGPTVQVGASIMSALGRLSPERQRRFILAGSAAGLAAAFNAPLAGIVFAIEEMTGAFRARATGIVIGAIFAAGVASIALAGDYVYFGTTDARLPLGRDWVAILVASILGGLAGGLFSRLCLLLMNGLTGGLGAAVKQHPVLFAALCGLGVALCGMYGGDGVFGAGYTPARHIVHGEDVVSPWFFPLKFLATVLTTASGIPGGLFSPSLSIGAGLAVELKPFFPHAQLGALAAICMVAYLTGVLHSPITAFVIVSEMTNDHQMVVPLMAAASIGHVASRLVSREGLYHALSKNFLPANQPATTEAR